jgi:uncharacterized membrane protein YecN with MAPEG domain
MGIITGNTLPITSLYGGILAIAFALTALAVGLTRAGTNVYYGSKDKTPLQYRVRANGSIGEHGIWGIAVLGLLEYNQVLGSGQLWWWGLLFTVFRLAHAAQLAVPETIPVLVRMGSFLATVGLVTYGGLRLAASGLHASS